MSFYVTPFTFNFETSFIDVDSGTFDIDCIYLYTACKLAQASTEGIIYGRIAAGSGLNTLGPGVQVGLTVEFLGSWQLRFPNGNYIARVAGGNLVGGPGGDPIAYTAGVQTLLIQSAASTVVVEGGSSNPLDTVLESSMTAAQMLRVIYAYVANPATGLNSNVQTVYKSIDGSKNRIVGTVDDNGARTITSVDGT